MERIFISYKRKNKEQVFSIVKKIESQLGVKCWVDLDGIESSAQFRSKICKAIDNAEVVLFMHSSVHLDIDFEKDWTIKELNYAEAKEKRVVLIKLDNSPLDNIFLLDYGAKNNIDSRDETQIQKLLKDLRTWLKLSPKAQESSPEEYFEDEYEDEHIERSKPHLNITTIGHVDHGKTTLTSAITLVLGKMGLSELRSYNSVDNAPTREVNGVTFNAACVEYETARRHYAHFDCPGNTDYVKLMIAGPQLDGGIVVCDMTDGPMPGTVEQIKLARQLNIPRLVVFVNKYDLEENDEMLDVVEMEMRELLSAYEYDGKRTPIIFGSALGAMHGVEEWEDKVMELMNACDKWIPLPPRAVDKPFLVPVEDVFSITGRGTVATGRIETGVIHVNDKVQILGLGQDNKAVVIGVEMFRKLLDEGQAGDNVGLLLRGIDKNEIKRGMVLCKPGSVKLHSTFTASIYVLKEDEGGRYTSLYNRSQLVFNLRGMDCLGEISSVEGTRIVKPGDNAAIKVNLTYPVVLNNGLHFTIRERGHNIGIGKITGIAE